MTLTPLADNDDKEYVDHDDNKPSANRYFIQFLVFSMVQMLMLSKILIYVLCNLDYCEIQCYKNFTKLERRVHESSNLYYEWL